MRTNARSAGSSYRCAIAIVPVLLLVCVAGAWAEPPTPSAPPEGELAFDIPLEPGLVEDVVELKMEFVRGVAASAVGVASEHGIENAETVVGAAGDLASVASRISASIEKISDYDPTFGIDGVARMMPAQGAVRDTLFGIFIWHERLNGASRETATDLERVVRQLGDLGNVSLRMGRDIGEGTAPVEGSDGIDYVRVAENTASVMNAIVELEVVAAEAETAATELEQIVWTIRDGSSVDEGSRVDDEWAAIQTATSEIRRIASRIAPAATTLQGSNETFVGIMYAVNGMATHAEMIHDLPADARGMRHLPWEAMRTDVSVVEPLKVDVIAPAEEEGAYPQDSLDEVKGLLAPVVESNRLLAFRAIEHATLHVAMHEDRILATYRARAGYDDSADPRDRQEAQEQVNALLAGNMELQSALAAARAAREWYADGLADQAAGYCSENKALIAFKNAWVHALNAGAAAQRALAQAGS